MIHENMYLENVLIEEREIVVVVVVERKEKESV